MQHVQPPGCERSAALGRGVGHLLQGAVSVNICTALACNTIVQAEVGLHLLLPLLHLQPAGFSKACFGNALLEASKDAGLPCSHTAAADVRCLCLFATAFMRMLSFVNGIVTSDMSATHLRSRCVPFLTQEGGGGQSHTK